VPYLDKERKENLWGRMGFSYAVMWEYVTNVLCVDSEMLLQGGVQSEAPKCVSVSQQTATPQDFPANNAA